MSQPTLEQKILAYLDAELTPDEERALCAELGADPVKRRLFAQVVRLHGRLCDALRGQGGNRQAGAPDFGYPPARARRPLLIALWTLAAAGMLVWVAVRGPGGLRHAKAPAGNRRALTGTTLPPSPAAPSGLSTTAFPRALGRDGGVTFHAELSFDFEDGRQGPPWHLAPTRECPPRAGNKFCLRVRQFRPDQPFSIGADLGDGQPIFRNHPGQAIRFDYWIGTWTANRPPDVRVWIHDAHQNTAYYYKLDPLAPGRWETLLVPLDAFVPEHPGRAQPRVPAGAPVDFLVVGTNTVEQDILFIDNLSVGTLRP